MKCHLAGLGLMLLCLIGISGTAQVASTGCEGNFVNPIADVCWECILPMTIGDVSAVKGRQPDAPNPSMPVQSCLTGILYRVGLAIGYWEPMALTDVTRSPYYMVSLGGFNINTGNVGSGTGGQENRANPGVFHHAHWYKYPLTYWLNIITSMGCLQGGDLDISYLSELDLMWDSSSSSMTIQPEATLFGNVIAQGACAADVVASLAGKPIDAPFWCAGSQGSMYPPNGYVSNELSPLQTFLLFSERMTFKLHRQGIVMNNIGENTAVCFKYSSPIIPKSRWRYHLVNKHPDADQCYPLGRSVARWEAGKNMPSDRHNFGYFFRRKRNCVFL